jgi:hypothetical protein
MIDRYLQIVTWAKRRYMIDGILYITIKGGPTRYKLIEDLAWRKYVLQGRNIIN